jgi:hypothetical protein
LIGGKNTIPAVDHKQKEIDLLKGAGGVIPDLLWQSGAPFFDQTWCVHQEKVEAPKGDGDLLPISGDSWLILHDSDTPAHKAIKESGFSYIGTT